MSEYSISRVLKMCAEAVLCTHHTQRSMYFGEIQHRCNQFHLKYIYIINSLSKNDF